MVSRPAGPEERVAKHLVPANATLVPTNINAVILRSGKTFEVIIPSWRTQRSGDDWCSNANSSMWWRGDSTVIVIVASDDEAHTHDYDDVVMACNPLNVFVVCVSLLPWPWTVFQTL